MASSSSGKPAFRVQTLKKILDLAQAYQLEELSFQGIYLKRGGPPKAEKSKAQPVADARPVDWEINEIDAANAPILDAYRKELEVQS